VLATRNSGKVAEFTELLTVSGLTLISLREFPDAPDVEEQGATYVENARTKALAAACHTGHPALGDDSGLEVDALGGRPGVLSARFAGEPGDSRRNVALLLEQLRDVPTASRTARFRCVLVVARPEGTTLEVEGSCEGIIALSPAGEAGFGYDPVFYVPRLGRTFAEISSAEKHRLSHRGRACAALRPRLLSFVTG
jgi:XTP/dITP diphosphohydrolase